MSTATRMTGCHVEDGIVYPDDDGVEMGDNSAQFSWIVLLFENLMSLYLDDPQVAVMGNMNWYPVKGEPRICRAPDVMVAFGRGKERRGSYIQWLEDNIAPQVVFEILSPGNSATEMVEKLSFYEQHDVEEFYLYDPDTDTLKVWIGKGHQLVEVPAYPACVSPRLQIRFEHTADEGLKVFQPDGTPFLTLAASERERQKSDRRAAVAEWERDEVARAKARVEAAASAEIESLRERLRQAGLE